jgi:hypothetical protein
MAKKCVFRHWKTIKVGARPNTTDLDYKLDLSAHLWRRRYECTNDAKGILDKVHISRPRCKIKLSRATTRELIGRSGTLEEIARGIEKKGGSMLPAEAAEELRGQYYFQPKGEYLFIAMWSLICPAESWEYGYTPEAPYIFVVAHEPDHELDRHVYWKSGRILDARKANLNRAWGADCEWVFRYDG